jgi:hypothetical protein
VKSKQASTHITISVPLELKREMQQRPEINWSRIAAKAFEKRLEAERVLGLFAEPDISEEEAIQRGLRLKHKAVQRAK